MRLAVLRVMVAVYAASVVGPGCIISDPDERLEYVDTDVPVQTGEYCAEPSSGAVPNQCQQDNDCFWSYCSSSRCVDGACVHKEVGDGTTCLDPDVGYGECASCTCVVDP